MNQYGSGTRGGGPMRRATRMERLINKSGHFKAIRSEGAGFGTAPRWRKKYTLTGTNYYLYLMFNETYHIQNGKNGPFVNTLEFTASVSPEVRDFMQELAKLGEEIHGSGEE